MRTVYLGLVGAAVLTAYALPAPAQTRGTQAYLAHLVPEMCGAAPCNAARITFGHGRARIAKRKPTDLVLNSSVGRISLDDVIPPQLGLEARVSATLSYGSDPSHDCAQANSRVVVSPWATSSLTCDPVAIGFYTPCSGKLRVTALTPPECTDVPVIVENITVDVYQAGFAGDPTRRIGGDGLAVGGQSPDCNSGGTGGCP
jgi:hypothetical protein